MSDGRRKGLIIALVVIVVIVGVVIAYQILSGPGPAPGPGKAPVVSELLVAGTEAPDFSFTSIQNIGEETLTASLSDYAGSKAVVLIFPTPTDTASMKQTKTLNATRLENEENLQVIAILGGAPPMAKNFLELNRISFPVVVDQPREIRALYGVGPRPVLYFIGKDGLIASVLAPGVGDPTSPEEFEANLRDLVPLEVPEELQPEEAIPEVTLPAVPDEEMPLTPEEIELP